MAQAARLPCSVASGSRPALISIGSGGVRRGCWYVHGDRTLTRGVARAGRGRWRAWRLLGERPDVLTYLTPGRVPEPPPLVPTRYPDRYRTQVVDFMRTYLTTRQGQGRLYRRAGAQAGRDKAAVHHLRPLQSQEQRKPVRGQRDQAGRVPRRQAQPIPSGRSGACAAVLRTSAFPKLRSLVPLACAGERHAPTENDVGWILRFVRRAGLVLVRRRPVCRRRPIT